MSETATHVTRITPPDAAGHWGWECTCWAEATGYEEPDEVLAAAEFHGPLAADSLTPADKDEEE